MEHISIFNYEAFYLDFLEGNLNVEETALFLAFMEAHPELRLEDEALLAMEDEFGSLDQSFKEHLKHLNFNEADISLTNVEQFLIAQSEGLLSDTKNAELILFLAQDPILLHTQRLYECTKIKTPVSIVYADKSSLKRARRIALWPILSLAAAASVMVFFFIETPTIEFGDSAHSTAKFDLKSSTTPTVNSTKSYSLTPLTQSLKDTCVVESQQLTVHTNQRFDVNRLKSIALNPIRTDEVENEVEFEKLTPIPSPSTFDHKTGAFGFQDMKNPIKPITNRLSEAIKQEVDFRTAKATKEKAGGFYLKIGKLEISHRKSRK